MSQHDYVISNQSFPSFRQDLNNALSAIQTCNSGTSRPTGAVAGQIWLDTTTATSPTLKYYDGADDISLATIDHSANTVNWLDSTVSITGLTTTATGTVLTLTDTHLNSTVSIRLPNATAIADDSGNEYIKFAKTASAVNEISITNSATGVRPTISATGDDTNIGININPKGTGTVTVTGNLSVDSGTIKLDGNYPVGTGNVALGDTALDDASLTGGCNTAIGNSALTANTSGICNVAIGSSSLSANTTGQDNTAIGHRALRLNTTANNNVAIGPFALDANTTGACNISIGNGSLVANTTASDNIAVGHNALLCNTTGCQNTAIGSLSLDANTTGICNIAIGQCALTSNTTAEGNVAIGHSAMLCNLTGFKSVAIGRNALKNINCQEHTGVGDNVLFTATTGNSNAGFGRGSLENVTTGSNNSAFGTNSGSDALASLTTENSHIVMGNTSHTCARIKIAWTVVSDARDKTCIDVVPHGLCFVNQLNPISYFYKKSRERNYPTGRKRYGFKAQDILPLEQGDAVVISDDEPENLKYNESSLIPILVNAIKELTTKVEDLQNRINQLES